MSKQNQTTEKFVVPSWATQKYTEVTARKQLKVLPIYKFKEGETTIEVIGNIAPRDKNFGTDDEPQIKTLYTIRVEGKIREIAPSKTFEDMFLCLINKGHGKIKVTRFGKALEDTKYKLEGLE